MDKDLLIKLFAVGIVLFFIFEMFAFGKIGQPAEAATNTQPVALQGTSEFDAMINSYDPYLVFQSLDDSQISEIKRIDGVEGVMLTDRGQVVSLKSPKYIGGVYNYSISSGLNVSAVANVALPPYLAVSLSNGSTEQIIFSGSTLKMGLEPFAAEGDNIRVKMNVEAEGGYLTRYSPPTLVPVQIALNSSAKVESALFDIYRFSVPWENRTHINASALEAEYGLENVTYSRTDYVSFSTPLSTSDMLTKKYDYVSVINENSITPVANYTDKARIEADFPGAQFADSVLEIKYPAGINATLSIPSAVNSSLRHVYSFEVSDAKYKFSDPVVYFATEKQLAAGDSMNVTLSVLSVGKTVVNVLDFAER